MKLRDLSGAHIGSLVTIEMPGATVSGILFKLSASADLIAEHVIARPVEYAPGRVSISAKVGYFEAGGLDGNLNCEVQGK